jgi:hypothetical protein
MQVASGSPSLSDTFVNDASASDQYLEHLNVSVRARNILFRLGIKSDEELAQIKPELLLRQRNCGKKTMAEIMDLIETLPLERACEPLPPKPHFKSDIRCLGLSDSNTDALRKLSIEKTTDLSRVSDEELLNAGLWNVAEIRDGLWEFFVTTEEQAILLNDKNPLEYLRLSVRATGGAEALGITTVGDLAAVQDHQFLRLQNIGRKSIRDIHVKLLRYFVYGQFDGDEKQPLPDRPKALLEELIAELPRIQRDVLMRRLGLWNRKPEILQDIGDSYGCTRERIRQIESQALVTLNWPGNAKKIRRFLDCLFKDHFGPIFQKGYGIAMEDELRVVFLSLFTSAREAMGVEQLISKAFLNERSIYEECCLKTDDGLFADEEEARRQYLALIKSVQTYLAHEKKPTPLSTLLETVRKNNRIDTYHLSREAAAHFIRMAPEIRTDDSGFFGLAEWRYMRPKTLRDMIVRALVDIGKPAHFTQIAMRVNERFCPNVPLNAKNIHARLVYDHETFVWQSNGVYGLSAWGLKKAPYVKDRLVKILKSVKQPMSLHQLVPKVLETCHCNKNTPAAILEMHRDLFVRLDKGIYGLREWTTT